MYYSSWRNYLLYNFNNFLLLIRKNFYDYDYLKKSLYSHFGNSPFEEIYVILLWKRQTYRSLPFVIAILIQMTIYLALSFVFSLRSFLLLSYWSAGVLSYDNVNSFIMYIERFVWVPWIMNEYKATRLSMYFLHSLDMCVLLRLVLSFKVGCARQYDGLWWKCMRPYECKFII